MLKRKSSVANFLCRSLNWNTLRKESLKKIQACTGLAFDHALSLYLFFFSSLAKEAKKQKKVAPDLRLVRDSNPWPLRYQCSAIPIDHSRKEATASFLKHLEDTASCWRAWKKVEKEGKKDYVDFKIRIFVVFTGNYWRGSWSTGDVSITRKLIKVRNAVWWKFVDFSLTTTLIWVSFPFGSLCG